MKLPLLLIVLLALALPVCYVIGRERMPKPPTIAIHDPSVCVARAFDIPWPENGDPLPIGPWPPYPWPNPPRPIPLP